LYNPAAAPFTTKRAMENSEYSVAGKVTDEIVMGVECDPKKNATGSGILFTRYGHLPNSYDKKSYDQGFVQVCTQGALPGINIGEIWVTYSCRLSKLRVLGAPPLHIGDGFSYTIGGFNLAAPDLCGYISSPAPGGSVFPPTNLPITGPFPLPTWNMLEIPWKDPVPPLPPQATLNYTMSPNCKFTILSIDALAAMHYLYTLQVQFTSVPAGKYRWVWSGNFMNSQATPANPPYCINATPRVQFKEIEVEGNASLLNVGENFYANTLNQYQSTGVVYAAEFEADAQQGQITITVKVEVNSNAPPQASSANIMDLTSCFRRVR